MGWFKVRFRIHQCRRRFYTRFAAQLACQCFTCARSRAGHSARFVVLPDSTRGTIISNKSLTVDVLSAVLAAFQRKRDVRDRWFRQPFDGKTMRIAHSPTRFVHERENNICSDLFASTMRLHVLPYSDIFN